MSGFDLTTREGVTAWCDANYKRVHKVERLSGGLVNYVWRIHHLYGTDILKYAAPYVASAPEISLDVSRVQFESKALALFEAELSGVGDDRCRAPFLRQSSPVDNVLVMEDVAPLFRNFPIDVVPKGIGRLVGGFLARLHSRSEDNESISEIFQNDRIQHTRFSQQYNCVTTWLSERCEDSEELGEVARAFGRSLLDPGECLIMGDMWLPSMMGQGSQLVESRTMDYVKQLRIIDWEFAHFGRPSQDIAHFAAHLWLGGRRLSQDVKWDWRGFKQVYRQEHDVWDGEVDREIEIHAACEILSRTVGPFAVHFHSWTQEQINTNVAFATALLRGEAFSIS